MDACTVFAFVLPGKISRKYVGARTLAQEIQVNLLFYLWLPFSHQPRHIFKRIKMRLTFAMTCKALYTLPLHFFFPQFISNWYPSLHTCNEKKIFLGIGNLESRGKKREIDLLNTFSIHPDNFSHFAFSNIFKWSWECGIMCAGDSVPFRQFGWCGWGGTVGAHRDLQPDWYSLLFSYW